MARTAPVSHSLPHEPRLTTGARSRPRPKPGTALAWCMVWLMALAMGIGQVLVRPSPCFPNISWGDERHLNQEGNGWMRHASMHGRKPHLPRGRGARRWGC